jgi:proteasome accessory factor B
LSRITDEPKSIGKRGAVSRPEAVDLTAIVAAYDAALPSSVARVRIRAGRCLGLRRLAVSTEEGGTAEGGDGWDVVTVAYVDAQRLADQVLPYGPDAVLLEPAEAVDVVVRRLESLAGEAS